MTAEDIELEVALRELMITPILRSKLNIGW
jgi:hypothetical protein